MDDFSACGFELLKPPKTRPLLPPKTLISIADLLILYCNSTPGTKPCPNCGSYSVSCHSSIKEANRRQSGSARASSHGVSTHKVSSLSPCSAAQPSYNTSNSSYSASRSSWVGSDYGRSTYGASSSSPPYSTAAGNRVSPSIPNRSPYSGGGGSTSRRGAHKPSSNSTFSPDPTSQKHTPRSTRFGSSNQATSANHTSSGKSHTNRANAKVSTGPTIDSHSQLIRGSSSSLGKQTTNAHTHPVKSSPAVDAHHSSTHQATEIVRPDTLGSLAVSSSDNKRVLQDGGLTHSDIVSCSSGTPLPAIPGSSSISSNPSVGVQQKDKNHSQNVHNLPKSIRSTNSNSEEPLDLVIIPQQIEHDDNAAVDSDNVKDNDDSDDEIYLPIMGDFFSHDTCRFS